MDPAKPWVNLGNPCVQKDKDIFASAIKVVVGDGRRASFWDSSWLDGMRPKDIAPKIFELSTRKNCSVKKALHNNFWVSKVDIGGNLTVSHISEFVNLWGKLSLVNLNPEETDSITWKLTNDGQYSAASAYNTQFLGLVD